MMRHNQGCDQVDDDDDDGPGPGVHYWLGNQVHLVMLLFSCQTKLKKQTFPKQFSESESPNNWA